MTTQERIEQLEAENITLRGQVAEYQAKEKAAKDAAEVAAGEGAKLKSLTDRGLSRAQAVDKLKRQRDWNAGKTGPK